LYLLMSGVAFGVLPGERLRASAAPMADVGAQYLPLGAAAFVTLGAIMAITTSLNATMLVPSRVAIMLAEDSLAPKWLGRISPRTGTPIVGLTLTLLATLTLLISGQISLALNIAVFALVVLYFLHSFALLALPRANPELFQSVTVGIPLWLQRVAAVTSMISMGLLIALQIADDLRVLGRTTFVERATHGSLTTIELVVFWAAVGTLLVSFGTARLRRTA
jgi:amino acid transporter